jgi:hypothetical protein
MRPEAIPCFVEEEPTSPTEEEHEETETTLHPSKRSRVTQVVASPSSDSDRPSLTLEWKEAAIVALSRVYTPKHKQNNVQKAARALVRTGKAGKRSGTQNTRCTNADLVALKVFHEVDAPVEGMKSTVMRAQICERDDSVWIKEAKKVGFDVPVTQSLSNVNTHKIP